MVHFGLEHKVQAMTGAQYVLKQKKVSPHTFRHTTAMHLLQAGNEINVVSLWLGHAGLNT
ncbi:MAG: tyrosine-type recombinase/integrase, partial [bacterium]|nr:tyrosine-type recombinase/integrase [bacterium]